MAVVWQARKAGRHYQIRSAGESLRLYTDGVFHSQWNPRRPLSGHLWDLLFLPLLFHPRADATRRVLVLGVGGGSLINLLNYFLPPGQITGVDLDATHLQLAKRFFLSACDNIELVHSDAKVFVCRRKTPKYDFIVEDIFCGDPRDRSQAVRAIEVDGEWLAAMRARLTPHGVLAINFASQQQLRQTVTKDLLKACGFARLYRFTNQRYENAVAVLLRQKLAKKDFQNRLEALVQVHPRRVVADLSYRLERVL